MTHTVQRLEQLQIPSTVDLVVAWMKTRTPVTNIAGQRISTTLPVRDSERIWPWLTVSRVIGITALPEAAIDRARIQFDAHGGTKPNGAPDWEPADKLIRAVEREIRTTLKARVDGKGQIMGTGVLEGIQQLQDPDTGGARFWMDAIVIAKEI